MNMNRRTKIVATIGPAVDSKEKIDQLISAGVNVFRINCSHGNWETRTKWIKWIRELSPVCAPIAILIDLQGPKFRIGNVPETRKRVESGEIIKICLSGGEINLPSEMMYHAMEEGDRILLGDGEIGMQVISKTNEYIEAEVTAGGPIRSNIGITLIGKTFDVPPLTEKDIEDVKNAAALDIDFIGLSYVRSAADLRQLRREVELYDKDVQLCAKIENQDSVNNLDDILKVADVIMVARGDLGLQLDIEDIPIYQKKIIEKSAAAGKPVITATQMLESMIHNARPTRAEVTDVANAILDGTDAIMLSGETANGHYPIEAVRTMSRIALKAESLIDFEHRTLKYGRNIDTHYNKTAEPVALSAVRLATTSEAEAIITTSHSGLTARMIAKYRPECDILCVSWNKKSYRQMAVIWGTQSLYLPLAHTTEEIISDSIDLFLKHQKIKIDDTIVITAGMPVGGKGCTNLIHVHVVK